VGKLPGSAKPKWAKNKHSEQTLSNIALLDLAGAVSGAVENETIFACRSASIPCEIKCAKPICCEINSSSASNK
jgi:hypothetical protein